MISDDKDAKIIGDSLKPVFDFFAKGLEALHNGVLSSVGIGRKGSKGKPDPDPLEDAHNYM